MTRHATHDHQVAVPANLPMTLRPATSADDATVDRLAGRDGEPPLAGPVVVSVSDGTVVGALSLSTGRLHHDPFRATPAQRSALRAYAAFATAPARRRGLLARLRGDRAAPVGGAAGVGA